MTTGIWPEEEGAREFGDVFEPLVDIERWAEELRARGIDARCTPPDKALLRVPDTIASHAEERAWIEAHRPPPSWHGTLIVSVSE